MIHITVNGTDMEYPDHIRYQDIAQDFKEKFENDIILVMNVKKNKLMELWKRAKDQDKIQFLTTQEADGHKTYVRGMTLLMLKSMYDILGHDKIEKILVEYSIGNGYYCDFEGTVPLTQDVLEKVKARMKELVEKDIPFEKNTMNTDDAVKLFEKYRMYDKQKLFRYRRVSKANIYRLGEFEDYFYGYMPPSTGILKYFDLFLYKDGFILQVPNEKNPRKMEKFETLPKLYTALRESNQWGKTMEVDTVGALNDIIAAGEMGNLLLVQEALQEKKIAEIAQSIVESHNKKFIMIAGPSSSGKTTFSHRLSIQLRTHGLKPHPIELDNYFVNREQTPLDEDGKPNYECLGAIDVEQFNKDMTELLNGAPVELPAFNFITGRREYKGNYKTLGENDILVIEGIHGLNDKLSYTLPKESKYKIYISALTQLNIDEHNRIPTTDGRLIRRIVRDARTRGSSAKRTISMWPSVRRGEENNIFLFQEEADIMFNSALIYELAILKQYAEPILFAIEKDSKEYTEAKRLLKFLDYFLGVSSEDVPKNSILREFIGGSCFRV